MSKEFHTGSLKHTVTFKKNVRGSLGHGSEDGYQTFLVTKCSLEKRRSSKQVDSGQVEIAGFFRMRCRFDTNFIPNLSGTCIAVIENQFGQDVTYVIHDFDLFDEKRHLYEFIISKSSV